MCTAPGGLHNSVPSMNIPDNRLSVPKNHQFQWNTSETSPISALSLGVSQNLVNFLKRNHALKTLTYELMHITHHFTQTFLSAIRECRIGRHDHICVHFEFCPVLRGQISSVQRNILWAYCQGTSSMPWVNLSLLVYSYCVGWNSASIGYLYAGHGGSARNCWNIRNCLVISFHSR